MTAPTPPIRRADQIRLAFDAGHITRREAIAELRAIMQITEQGAAVLLDDGQMPSAPRHLGDR